MTISWTDVLDLVDQRLDALDAELDADVLPAGFSFVAPQDMPLPTPDEAERAQALLARHQAAEQRMRDAMQGTARELDDLATRRRAGRAYTA